MNEPTSAASRLTLAEQAVIVADGVLRQFEQSGYGTTRTDRWTPFIRVQDVLLMAHALVEGEGDR